MQNLTINTPLGPTNPLIINENMSGTINTYQGPPSFLFHVPGLYAGSYISAFNNGLAATGSDGFAQALWVDLSVGGSAVVGNQNSAMFTLEVTAPTNSAARSTRYYSPIYMNAFMDSNDGGTGTDLVHSQGNLQGGSATASLLSGATNMRAIEGWEFDVAVNTGASVWLKNGISITSLGTDQVHGTWEGMIDIGGQTGNIGWNNVILINDLHSAFGLSSTACIICTDGATHTIGTGFDFGNYTMTGNVLKWTNGYISGSGQIGIAASTAPGTPAAGNFVIYMDVADNKLKAKGPSGTVTVLANP